MIQQAIAQQLQPLFEPLFSEGSYGYRPGRSAQQAIRKVKFCSPISSNSRNGLNTCCKIRVCTRR
ncbi:hypothetical protein ACF3MZ_26400 [Paenibacillaceae bacterium WGS1546]|uniref:hypothetical protein n=1 Tax=Cohnella sp. WGS1546 TaxID=3366810 RepID=UPI00372D74B1